MTDKQEKENAALAAVIDSAPPYQLVVFMFWAIFSKKRAQKILDGLVAGKSWMYAYKDAKI